VTAATAAVGWPIQLGARVALEGRSRLFQHARAVALGGLLVSMGSLAYGLVLWAGQRFAPPPVSFVTSDLPIVVHLPMIVAFSLVGAIVATRQPRNAIGWLFLGIGMGSALIPAIDLLVAGTGNQFVPAPAHTVFLAWLASNFHLPLMGSLVIVVFLIFPDGAALPGRWSWAAWLALGGALLVGLGQALDPSGLRWYPTLPNPTAGPAWFGPYAIGIQVTGLGLVMTALGIATWAMVVRYRRYPPERRHDLFWIAVAVVQLAAAGGALLVVRYGVVVPTSAGEPILIATLVAATLVPLAAANGMIRHHLFDIDLVLTHALVYVPLTGLLAGLYAAAVALFQRVFVALTGDTSDFAIILTTLVLAGTFSPLRKSLEGVVDRHFKPGSGTTSAEAPIAVAAGAPASADPAASPEGAPDAALDPTAELHELQARLARLERVVGTGS